MTDDWKAAVDEIEIALDDAICEVGLGETPYGRRLKQMLRNRLKEQYREEDLVDLLADMPIKEEDAE